MSKKTISWGFIGCGDVTEKKSGPAFQKSALSAVVAVMCRHEERAADYARRHGIPRYYTDADRLITDPEVDAIYVATPPGSHARYAIAALEARKPVYVEKPMGLDYNECLAMAAVARRTATPLYVAYYRRAMPYFVKIKELLDKQVVGDVLAVTLRFMRPPLAEDTGAGGYWRLQRALSGGGYLLDMGSHQINLLQYFFGEIAKAEAIVANRGKLYEVEDTVTALLQFRSGLPACCSWCFVTSDQQHEDTVEISGSRGTIRFSVFDMKEIVVRTRDFEDIIQVPAPEHVQMPMIERVNRLILAGDPDTEWTRDAALTSHIIDLILK